MRILWVTRGSGDPAEAGASAMGGDIYDRKICAGLQPPHTVQVVSAPRGGRLAQIARAGLRLSAPETFAFDSPAAIDRVVHEASKQPPDVIVFAHEHLDRLAGAVRRQMGKGAPAFVSVRQNMTSDTMASFLEDYPPLAVFYRALAERQERDALNTPLFQAVVLLSVRDEEIVHRVFGRRDTTIVMPGAPPALPLAPDARLVRELVLLGTYDWFPKARDLRRFAADLARDPLPDVKVYGDAGVPETIAAQLGMAPTTDIDLSAAIRFGVITDRFTAGHKLKTAAYLAQNCAVISFADVIHDFAPVPHAQGWIHRVRSVREIGPIIDAMRARPHDEVRAELIALKTYLAEKFTWRDNAAALSTALEATVRPRRG